MSSSENNHPSYHDLHITTAQHPKGLPASPGVLIAGEYGGAGKWLVLDVAGHVIVDSREREPA
jgi:hypothetical protein